MGEGFSVAAVVACLASIFLGGVMRSRHHATLARVKLGRMFGPLRMSAAFVIDNRPQ